MVVISYGIHSHPPPPSHRIPHAIMEPLHNAIRAYGVAEATTRKLISSPILPLMLNGKTSLAQVHVALANQDVVNRLIRKERAKEYPWGTDFQGVQYLISKENPNSLYIRRTELFDDGRFIILCQSKEQSRLLMHSIEIFADKTFRRTKCREFEVNGYDPVSKRIVTLAHVFMDYEDAWSYFQAFKLIFDQAEKDMGYRIPFGHLTTDAASRTGTRIKVILLDEHPGQIRGLALYFKSQFPNDELDFHILRIVKICIVHFKRSLTKLLKKDQNNQSHQGYSELYLELIVRTVFSSWCITWYDE